MSKLPIQTINDIEKLNLLRSICFTKHDLRAGWIGAGIPATGVEEFKLLRDWSAEHWYMYTSFIELEMPEIISGKKILDIGSGMGTATLNLGTLYPECEIIGVDSDREAVEFAKKYNQRANIKYITADFFKLPIDTYDYIFALEVYEHIPPLLHKIFIDKCLDSLNPNGQLFITTPNEPDAKDAAYGHVGFLNKKRVIKFIARYKNNILHSSFINNKKILTGEVKEFIIFEPIESFEPGYSPKSHFRLIMQSDGSQKLSRYWKKEIVFYPFLIKVKWVLNLPPRIIRRLIRMTRA